MTVSKPAVVAAVLVVLGLAAYFLFAGGPGKYDSFAKCLSDKGAKMYGAFWCPHCKEQKELFGKSWQYVDYVECSTPDGQGQLEICKSAGIKGYPTWEFADGKRQSGLLTLQELSQQTGCPIEG